MTLEDVSDPKDGGSSEETTNENGGAEGSAESSEKTFYDFVSNEDNRRVAERFDSLDSFISNFVEKQKFIDSSVRVPKEGASEEEWSKYYKSIGVPESHDQYFTDLPEDLDDEVKARIGRYAERMFGLKAHPDVVKASYEFIQQELQEELERQSTAREKAVETAEAEIRKEWSTQEAYDRNVRIAHAFIEKFGGEELKDVLDETGLGNNPVMLKFAAKVGSLFAEDFSDTVLRGGAVNEEDARALEAEYSKRVREGTERDPDFQRRWSEFFDRTYKDDVTA